jgi:hypothetical protein
MNETPQQVLGVLPVGATTTVASSCGLKRLMFALLVLCLLTMPASATALSKGGGHSRSTAGAKTKSGSVHVRSYTRKDGTPKSATPAEPKSSTRRSQSATGRTANGKISRSEAAKHQFMSQTGFPHGRPGYVIDHIKPLACGGADSPANMQWQTIAAAKAKDKTERIGCR